MQPFSDCFVRYVENKHETFYDRAANLEIVMQSFNRIVLTDGGDLLGPGSGIAASEIGRSRLMAVAWTERQP